MTNFRHVSWERWSPGNSSNTPYFSQKWCSSCRTSNPVWQLSRFIIRNYFKLETAIFVYFSLKIKILTELPCQVCFQHKFLSEVYWYPHWKGLHWTVRRREWHVSVPGLKQLAPTWRSVTLAPTWHTANVPGELTIIFVYRRNC